MKVLVTGAAGFIGRHVSAKLVEAGHEVLGMDKALQPIDGYWHGWYIADITKPLDPIPGLDAVIHLAALAAPRECDANPTKAFDINVNGTLQVLNMALKSGAKKVVFSSSAHVYGISPRYMPTDETHPLSLGNTYTTTKILGEALCELFWENHGLAYTTLRLYNAYGPDQATGYFIPDMVEKAKSGRVELKGGDTTKDFVHVDDVARAFAAAVETAFVGAINIGTGIDTPLWSVAQIVTYFKDAKLERGFQGVDPGTRMQAEITRAKKILGWTPQTTLREGLDAIVNSHKAISVS